MNRPSDTTAAPPVELSTASIDAIAHRVLELLRDQPELVDAATLARRLGISRDAVYERAEELGAIPLPESPKARKRREEDRAEGKDPQPRPRLRFDLADAVDRFERTRDPRPPSRPHPRRPPARRSPVPLLEVKDR